MSKIVVDSGIIIIMVDGTIINFPDGNCPEYRAWLKTEEANTMVWVMLADKESMFGHEVERAEAYDQLEYLYNNCRLRTVIEDDVVYARIAELFKNPRSFGYAESVMARWLRERNDRKKVKKQSYLGEF